MLYNILMRVSVVQYTGECCTIYGRVLYNKRVSVVQYTGECCTIYRKKIRRKKEDNVERNTPVEDVRPVSENLTVRTKRKIDSYCTGPEALGLQEKLNFFEANSRKEIGKEAARNGEEDPSKESTRKKIPKIEEQERKWMKKEENYGKNEEERKFSKMERNPWNGIEVNDVERKWLGISPRGKIGKHLKPRKKIGNEKIQELTKQLIGDSSPSKQVRPVHSKFNFYAVQEKGLSLRTEMTRTPGLATAPESAGNGPTRRIIRKWDKQDRI